MIVAISGSRTFSDRALVEKVVDRLLERGDFISVGDAPSGVDLFVAEHLIKIPGAQWKRHIARWTELGRGAGHERNHRVIEDAQALIAIFADGDLTPGTFDALSQAKKHRIPAFVYHEGVWRVEAITQRAKAGGSAQRTLFEEDVLSPDLS